MSLSHQEIQRYSRQLIVKGWGRRSQEALMQASIFISDNLPLAKRYLLAAGVSDSSLSTAGDFAAAILCEDEILPPGLKSFYTLYCGKDGSVHVDGSKEIYSSLPNRLSVASNVSEFGLAPAQLLSVLLVMKHIAGGSIVKP